MAAELSNLVPTLIPAGIAAVISYIAGRGMKVHEWKLSLAKENITARRHLYAEFLAEADRLVLRSMSRKVTEVSDLGELTTKFSEISLLSTEPVVQAAKVVCDYVISAQEAGRKTGAEKNFYGSKENFIVAARNEIAVDENNRWL